MFLYSYTQASISRLAQALSAASRVAGTVRRDYVDWGGNWCRIHYEYHLDSNYP